MKKTIFILAVLALFTSCTYRLTDFTVISTKNMPVGNENYKLEKASARVSGTDVGHTILYFPVSAPNMKEAIDAAIQSYPGCVGLADGVVKSKMWWAFLYGQNKYIVEGTPLIEVKGDSRANASSNVVNTYTPAPVAPVAPVSVGTQFFHEVKSTDTLQSIAQMYGVTIGEIIRWNNLSSSNITAGTKLQILLK